MYKHPVARSAAAAVMAGLLVSTPAFAASRLTVSDTSYEGGAAASGEGWTWDGADDMGLNGFNGGSIVAEGDLIVTVSGDNTVAPIVVKSDAESEGNLTLNGEEGASLTIDPNPVRDDPTTYHTSVGGSLEVNNLELQINDRVVVNDDLTIRNSTVDGEYDGTVVYVNNDQSGTATVTIENSHVHLVSTAEGGRVTSTPAIAVLGGDNTRAFREQYMDNKAYISEEQLANLERDYPEIADKYRDSLRSRSGSYYLPANVTNEFLNELMSTDGGQAALDQDITRNFINVEGDTEYGLVADAKNGITIGTALFGVDENNQDVLLEPVPDEEPDNDKIDELDEPTTEEETNEEEPPVEEEEVTSEEEPPVEEETPKEEPPATKASLPAAGDATLGIELVGAAAGASALLSGAALRIRKLRK